MSPFLANGTRLLVVVQEERRARGSKRKSERVLFMPL
jgi:hypothetical protein